MAKPQFLSNPENKQGLVSYLADKLNAVPGVLCSNADDDALEALVDNPGKAVIVSHPGETTLPRGTLLSHQEIDLGHQST